ncbi:protoporphyrinogen/coproporphyrinogen oxidase [Aquipuribacter nitratireducens]|uniref:Protoporphyrinogen/coproporphyrinogen oxidase n=1 Tax=Aquipuribacter nitratireducens TaxID=650104 RepID=A0ABW0GNH0_9MICO
MSAGTDRADEADVVVLGAGPAGLGAALRLAQSGTDVVVLEREDHVGGLTASHRVAGVSVDVGSHRLHPATDPVVMSLLRGLLGDELQTRRRNGRARLAGRWVDFPLRPRDLATTLPPGFLARAGLSSLAATVRRRDTSTFESYVRTGLGDVMGGEFYFPYARKVWGLDPADLSGEQARRRISADSPWRLLARVAAGRQASSRFFHYPAGGFGRISEVLADAARAAGARIRTDDPATALERDGAGGWFVTTGTGVLRARQVWSTVPLPLLARLAGLRSPDGSPLPSLPSRAMLVVHLVVPLPRGRRSWTPYDAHYLPGAATPLTRVSEPRNYRDGADPDGVTVLTAEVPCQAGDALWGSGDDALGRLVLDALASHDLPVPDVADVVVRRVPSAYPVHPVGAEAALERLLAAVDAVPGLLTFGRQGLLAHDNTHHTLAMAEAAVRCRRPDGLVDEAAWARAREGFAEHVVQD